MRRQPTHSFVPGTRVLLADGTSKPIEDIRLGDEVLAADPATGQSAARKVVATWVHDDEPERTQLTFTNGATLTGTNWHPSGQSTRTAGSTSATSPPALAYLPPAANRLRSLPDKMRFPSGLSMTLQLM
ncbi:Hint domain-containing protein [Actinokineospora globicatena]|uniref:Hint domain-containing protein n=1 Tax=Actinokineospora globicatena TaxID=103729 RepID=UPI0020A4E86A|nr:Hint domain-containing protein [Actinokineospora globicatena]GLW81039.1 hypothetical protein Aglo01_55200 [Actinokineospora globicatena]GLW88232.1 hypothetical protein Aglo02_58710 [Actinokineospora globicatena]